MLFYLNTNIFTALFLIFRADAGVGEPGRTVNPLADAFGGSNPSPPTAQIYILLVREIFNFILVPLFFCSFFTC